MISQKKIDENSIVIAPGKVLDNSNGHEMSEVMDAAQAQGYKYIILDLAELGFISSAGVGSILGSVEALRGNGGDIILCNLSEKILHIFEVLDLCGYLTIKSDEQAAIECCIAGS